jgi:hypothetical protein
LLDVEGLSGLVANPMQQGRVWIEFSFVCSLRISSYVVRNYVNWCASKELQDVFGNVLFRACEMWPKAFPDTLPSFDVLIMKPFGGIFFVCLLQKQASVHLAYWL